MRGGSPRNKGQKGKNGFRIAGQSLATLNPFPQTGVCIKKAVTILKDRHGFFDGS
jgi:hypothetical protein